MEKQRVEIRILAAATLSDIQSKKKKKKKKNNLQLFCVSVIQTSNARYKIKGELKISKSPARHVPHHGLFNIPLPGKPNLVRKSL
jgi:hypothetical protein